LLIERVRARPLYLCLTITMSEAGGKKKALASFFAKSKKKRECVAPDVLLCCQTTTRLCRHRGEFSAN